MPAVPPGLQKLFHSRPYEESIGFLQARLPAPPDIALVLGSGLGDYAESLPGTLAFPSGEIPSYPRSTVAGHKGAVVFARVSGKNVIAFQGRIHLYECNDLSMVLFPIIVAAGLGARVLIVTNAAGGINRRFVPGDLMLITDQIDFTLHPGGISGDRIASRSMYDAALVEFASRAAALRGLPVRRGVYAAVKGPSYETAAEVEMLYRLGGDAVGMSTVKEVALARGLGMRVMGISCITNKAAGTSPARLNHAEVTEVANRVKLHFAELLTDCISGITV